VSVSASGSPAAAASGTDLVFLPFLKKSFFLIFFFRIFCERLIGNHPNGAAWRPQG
jgi:hypothetical protein